MRPAGYAADPEHGVLAEIMRHLAEIGAGRTSIRDADLASAPTDAMRELLVGLLTLHEDLQYERSLRAVAEQQSDRLVADLRAAVAARDEFLSIASHELRTPLSTLRLQATALSRQLAQGGAREGELALAKSLPAIERQVTRLETLTAALLDVSRIASGHLDLHREPVDLVTVVREIVERFRGDHAGGPAITFDSDASVVGEWDPSRIDQVTSNLIANAFRYGDGTPIDVSVRAANGAARVSVRDQGIGIASDQKARIFERFERAASSAHYGGLGLGLWIARQVVEAHDGVIDVESQPGKGATFTVTLPLSARDRSA